MPTSTPDSASSLLQELQALNEMLGHELPDNIPVLNDLIEETDVVTAPTMQVTPAIEAKPKSTNPFLPDEVIRKLTRERLAAQYSVEEANRTMQAVHEQKQIRAQNTLTEIGKTLDQEQKDQLINQMVEEMLPQIADRLKVKLKIMLAR